MAEIREILAPDTAGAPEHTMSPEGVARLAALELGPPDAAADVVAKPQTEVAQQETDAPADKPVENPQGERTAPAVPVDASTIELLVISER